MAPQGPKCQDNRHTAAQCFGLRPSTFSGYLPGAPGIVFPSFVRASTIVSFAEPIQIFQGVPRRLNNGKYSLNGTGTGPV